MRRLAFILPAVLWPDTAWAHSSVPGIQGIYWGMLHPFTSGPQLLALLALSLTFQQRLPESQDMIHAFWIAAIPGAAAAALGLPGFNPDFALCIFAILAAVLTASAAKLPLPLLWAIGGLGGVFSGYVSWPDPGAKSDMLLSTIGAIVGSALTIIVVAGIIEAILQKWHWLWFPIAVRVAASWVAAISVLLGALLFRNMA